MECEMVCLKKKQNEKMKMKAGAEGKRLIDVNLVGSSGPIRFFVSQNQTVNSVIETAFKTFARQGRLPVLGCKPHQFALYYPTVSGWQVMEPSEAIGLEDRWNFRLYKKPLDAGDCATITRKRGLMNFKSWFCNISSHWPSEFFWFKGIGNL